MGRIAHSSLALSLVILGVCLGHELWPKSAELASQSSGSADRSEPLLPADWQSRRAPPPTTQLDLAAPRAKRRPGAIDVVLISWDTVRADDLQPYGSKLATSPFAAALARDGITFKHAYSTSSWTAPAMYSLMTGLYPREHGIVRSTVIGTAQPSQPVLPEAATTLAERLKADGYSTFGVSTNFHLTRRFGFAQGFDSFVGDGFSFRPFPKVGVDSLREATANSEKYFLWVHYFDAHFPYLERFPWFQQWNDSPFTDFENVGLNAALSDYWRDKAQPVRSFVPPEDAAMLPIYLLGYSLDPSRLRGALDRLTAGPENARARTDYCNYLRAAYRSEIRSIDSEVEQVFKRLGVDEQTLVILVADHGEEFFDHDRLGHRLDSLYQELISVPLIIRLPGGAHKGTVVEQPVSLIDLVPSIMELVHGEAPRDLLGRSFSSLLGNTAPITDRDIVSELTHLDGSEHRSLIRYPWKYIHHYRDGSGELYDLASDPGERSNLAARDTQRVAEMRGALEQWVTRVAPRWSLPDSVSMQGGDLQKLRALGYTASP
jgi:choline-sulfatase